MIVLGACTEYGKNYPNSTFNHTTEFNTAIDSLWDKLLFWGTLVFVVVEGILIYTIIRFRRRSESDEPSGVPSVSVSRRVTLRTPTARDEALSRMVDR